jgi:PhoH-like ATPase
MAASTPKLFVLDTNVILHDAGCIRNFKEHDIVIPITVLEELDRFKRGNDDIHFQAREFLRRIDALTGDVLAPAGCPLGPGLGSIRVVIGDGENRRHVLCLADTPDHRILAAALALREELTPRPVILVSKDSNLRMKAKSLGLCAQDYTSDKVEGFDRLYTGKRFVEGVASEAIDRLYAGPLPAGDLPEASTPVANENFVLRNGSKSALATFRRGDEAQNLTPHEVKTIITRAGEGTKIVLTGDVAQIDQPYLDALSNGFSFLINRMRGQPLAAHVTLEKGERSELADLASELL